MSFGGILATALAGGAGVIGKQAGDDIEQRRRLDIAAESAKIEEQMRMRLAEFSAGVERRANMDRLTDTRAFQSSDETIAASGKVAAAATANAIKGKVAEATNPELLAATAQQAEADLQREIRRIQATAKPEAEKAAAISEARARAEAKYRKADPTVASKMADMEKALGRPLTEQERLAAMGLAPKGRDPETGYETVEQKEYDANGQEVRKTTRKEPIRAGQGGGRAEQVDPYAVPKRDAVPAAKPAAAAKDAGPGMLDGLRKALGDAMDSGAQAGNAIEAIRRKVRASLPLTAEEAALAKKYSIL